VPIAEPLLIETAIGGHTLTVKITVKINEVGASLESGGYLGLGIQARLKRHVALYHDCGGTIGITSSFSNGAAVRGLSRAG
jgi:hypothetical protein